MTPETNRTATPAEAAKTAPARAPVPPTRRPVSPGALASRRRGSVLRRLLALGDWGALVGTLCLVTATTSSTDVGVLFWAVLFSPIWIVVLKLHGLYDNDHRRIRHSTLDELPSLVSATVLGTLVLDGLLALSPVGPLSPASATLSVKAASSALLAPSDFWRRISSCRDLSSARSFASRSRAAA